MLPDSKKTELGSSNQEASPSAGKNTGLVLMPCRAGKCVPTAISSGVLDISKVPGCHLNSGKWGYLEQFEPRTKIQENKIYKF